MKKARIIQEHKAHYIISDNNEEFIATVRGTFFIDEVFPKVGDYIEYTDSSHGKAIIENILDRTSVIVRRAVHTHEQQVIVANVDIVFIVIGLDNDFNTNRLERYLLLAKQSNVDAVVILNKRDVVDDYKSYIDQVKKLSGIAEIYAVCALSGAGMELLASHISLDTTVVLLGSSGAGKSTITNWLLSEDQQEVNSVRKGDHRGKHTTTSRQLFNLPHGGYLIDTPGMKELGVLESKAEDEDAVFKVLDALAQQCKFANCDHIKSSGCAVVIALEEDDISKKQLENYHKLQKERCIEHSKYNQVNAGDKKEKSKKVRKAVGKGKKHKKSHRDY